MINATTLAIGDEFRMNSANFGESPEGEVRRNPILGKWVNKGEREGQGCYAPVRE